MITLDCEGDDGWPADFLTFPYVARTNSKVHLLELQVADDDPYKAARELAQLYGSMEYALKRSGFLRKGRDDAQADWAQFAATLGDEFMVEARNIAPTLIGNPPRKLLAAGLKWSEPRGSALETVVELIVEGVCRVRNSYIHGEKFTGSPDPDQWRRDATLVAEALAVLTAAATYVPIETQSTIPRVAVAAAKHPSRKPRLPPRDA